MLSKKINILYLLVVTILGAVPDNTIKCYKVWDEKESIK